MKSFIIAALLFATPAFAGFTVPALKNPVNDYAGVLTASGKEAIAKMIVTLKEGTKAQLGVLIVNTLDGDNLEEASFRAAKAWKLGDKRDSDGVLLFVVVRDRKMRIEVGTGMESTLTDARSKQILAGMKPALRAKNYDLAIAGAVDSIFSTISAASAENSIQHASSPVPVPESNPNLWFWILLGIGLVGLVALVIYKSVKDEAERERKYQKQKAKYKEEKKDYDIYAASMAKQGKTARKEAPKKPKRESDDDSRSSGGSSFVGVYSSSSSSDSSYDSGSSSSSSDWGGGGGDFSGGGSSDSW